MKQLIFALPGDPQTRTGGYHYARRLIAGLDALGWRVELLRLPDVLADPLRVAEANRLLADTAPGVPVLVDGLALGVLPEAAEAVARRGPLVGLVHHPLAEETGLAAATAAYLRGLERAALAHTALVLVSSPCTARSLAADYAVPATRIVVAEPGVDPAPLAEGTGRPFTLLSVGSLTPRKGHRVLLEALERVSLEDWRLTVAGSPERDPDEARALQRRAADLRHSRRICFAGEVDDGTLAQLYRAADLFVLPSFHEGYGMVFTEALARGLPVLATRAGAIPETVPAGAGWLVPPGDADALAEALGRLLCDPAAYAGLRAGAQAARARLARWTETARRAAAALETLA